MLSSQTKDTTNALTMRRLQTELPAPGLTLQNILEIEPDKLNELIWAVGFHNNKTRYIKAAAPILRDEYNGDIPDTVEGLMSLPGVGPKMAYLCLSAAWDKHEGIGVDVHVRHVPPDPHESSPTPVLPSMNPKSERELPIETPLIPHPSPGPPHNQPLGLAQNPHPRPRGNPRIARILAPPIQMARDQSHARRLRADDLQTRRP